jgi:hypothetical protein
MAGRGIQLDANGIRKKKNTISLFRVKEIVGPQEGLYGDYGTAMASPGLILGAIHWKTAYDKPSRKNYRRHQRARWAKTGESATLALVSAMKRVNP